MCGGHDLKSSFVYNAHNSLNSLSLLNCKSDPIVYVKHDPWAVKLLVKLVFDHVGYVTIFNIDWFITLNMCW